MLTPEDLRTKTVVRFTNSPDFNAQLEKVIKEARSRIDWEIANYGSGFSLSGFVGLSTECLNKASRIFNYTIKEKKGRDKIKDEVEDFLNFALYLRVYFEMMEMEHGTKPKD